MPLSRTLANAALALSLRLALAQAPATPPPASPLVVGYFGQWGVYDGIFPRRLLTTHAADSLDQINYAQGFVTGGHCSVADPNADLNLTFTAANSVDGTPDSPTSPFRGDLHQFAELKRLYPRLKLLISLEGRASDFAADAQPANRAAFVRSCVDLFLRGNLAPGVTQPTLFDGIDLDWEYPHDDDAPNFIALLTELRAAMDALRPGLRLSVAVGPSPHMYPGVDIPALARLVDQVGVMNYDYHGPWNPTTNFIAPLFSDSGGSVDRSLSEWQAAGIPRIHLLMGLPFYGYGWRDVPDTDHGLLQPGRSIHGDRPWSFFAPLVAASLSPAPEPASQGQPGTPSQPAVPPPTAPSRSSPQPGTVPKPAHPDADATLAPPPAPTAFTLYRDPHSQAPWLYDGSTFWTLEDPVSIRYKASAARQIGLGGIMIWELGEDSDTGDLIKAAAQGLHGKQAEKEAHLTTNTTVWKGRNGRDD